MGNDSFYVHSGQHGHVHCPIHPSEPLIGLCGCGTFFCRQCSPSDVFCSRCHGEHERFKLADRLTATDYFDKQETANSRRSSRPSRKRYRRILEALLLVTLSAFAIVMAIGWLNQEVSLGLAENGLSLAPSLIPLETTTINYGINTEYEPLQRETSFFQTTMTVDGGTATLSSDTSYSISAKVESVKAYGDATGSVLPYDLLLAWGKMSESGVDSRLTWKQEGRQGMVYGALGGLNASGIDKGYVVSHISNNHIIPANERIRAALETIRPGDMVKIDGRLVEVKIKTGNKIISLQSSKSRYDQGDGACEVIMAERMKINERNYQ